MFTGLIESVGQVADVQRTPSGLRLRVRAALSGALKPGDSLAVNGICLTAVTAGGDEVAADVGPETARVTTLGSLRKGQSVNLERPMRADARFGGHFVLGHVDGTGRVEKMREEGEVHWLTVSFLPALAAYLIPKGSIALDGISLTIAVLTGNTFDVMIVPYTWEHTNLQALGVGDRVNLECDVVGKYVVRAVALADEGRLKPAPTT